MIRNFEFLEDYQYQEFLKKWLSFFSFFNLVNYLMFENFLISKFYVNLSASLKITDFVFFDDLLIFNDSTWVHERFEHNFVFKLWFWVFQKGVLRETIPAYWWKICRWHSMTPQSKWEMKSCSSSKIKTAEEISDFYS